VEQGDSTALARTAHALNGLLTCFHAQPATSAARRLEKMGRNGDLAESREVLAELDRELQRLRSALQSPPPLGWDSTQG
jgi:HPt (histidine-containing phosphotransfer) domain-containing protein